LGADVDATETNIVVLTVPDAAAVASAAREQGVLVSALGPTFLRLVTHLDVEDDAIDRAISVLKPLLHH
jgi:threonine aldolase